MDRTLVERARGGDREALERLLQEIAPLVHRFGLRMCRHLADADDVMQETLVSVVDHLPQYRGQGSLASWVFLLARTACARRRRGLKNRPHLPEEHANREHSPEPGPEQAAEHTELRAALEHALDCLTDEQREVLLLRDMEGLSAQEVAESLGISVDAVKSRLHRARAELRGLLDARYVRSPPPGPDCPDVLKAFSLKLEGDLSAADCAAMDQHLQGCASCSAVCSSLRTALWMCRTHAAEELSPDQRLHMREVVRKLLARQAP